MKKLTKRNLLVSFIIILTASWVVFGDMPPPAHQKIGTYDTVLVNLTSQDCRDCHPPGISDRHHLALGSKYDCADCHPSISGSALIDRNCINCHNGTAFYASPLKVNISKPHHNSTQAQSRDCKYCHGSFVDNYNDSHYIPSSNESFVTPHTDYEYMNATSGKKWGGCQACHEANMTITPAVNSNSDLHHNALINITMNLSCTWCHTDFNGTTTIRKCEDCHSVRSLHNIQNNFTVTNDTAGYGHIGTGWDCDGCHILWIEENQTPQPGAVIPEILNSTPSIFNESSNITLTITGSNFVNGNYSSIVNIDGSNITPAFINDSLIVLNISQQTEGIHKIKLIKTDMSSRPVSLITVKPVSIYSAERGDTITITGSGFGARPNSSFSDLGVFIKHYSTTFKPYISSWSSTRIVVSSSGSHEGDILTVKALYGLDDVRISHD